MNASAALTPLESFLPGEDTNTNFPLPPRISEAAANAVAVLYDRTSTANPKDALADRIILQNTENSVVKFKLSANVDGGAGENVAANDYHGILSADSAKDAGVGGTYICYPRRDGIWKITAITAAGNLRVAVQRFVNATHASAQ